MNPDTSYDSEPDDTTDPTEGSESDPQDSGDSGEKTTLIPNSMLTDPHPGDKVEMEIVHCYEDECEVRVVKKEKDKGSTADQAFVDKFGE